MPERVRGAAALVLLLLSAALLPAAARAETTKPIRMRVVEAGTGKPVAGAEVRYSAEAWEGTLTGHGGRTALMFDIPARSDAEGVIAIPPTAVSARLFGIFGLNTNYGNAEMRIRKPGYKTLVLRNNLRILPNLDEVIAWEHEGRTVELEPGEDPRPRELNFPAPPAGPPAIRVAPAPPGAPATDRAAPSPR